MSKDKILREQLAKIEERQKERVEHLGEFLPNALKTILVKQMIRSVGVFCFVMIFSVILVGYLGSMFVIPGIVLVVLSGGIILTFHKNKVTKLVKEEMEKMKEMYDETTSDLDIAIALANDAATTKTNFLSGVSHDIRSPINVVLGLDEMILRESRESKIRDYARDIKSAGETLMAFVSDLMDTSKIEEGQLEILKIQYDLSSIINDIRNINLRAANQKGLKLIVKVDKSTPHLLLGDELRIKQCILKLMSNAVKFTDEGSITVEVSYAKMSENEILMTISVIDTGCGIKAEDMERLFSPFEKGNDFRNIKNEGCGLGMSITKKLLELMDSELRVESEVGKGSTFKFSIMQEVVDWKPIGNVDDTFSESNEEPKRYEESFHAPDASVLVVDDSTVNLMIVEGLLKDTKMKITLAESGQKALDACDNERFDLILLDHMMPEMDGIETLHRIRDTSKFNKNSVIVALTANAVEGAKENYKKEGFDDYLSKPIEGTALERAVKTYLRPDLIKTSYEKKTYEADLDENAPFEEDESFEKVPQGEILEKEAKKDSLICELEKIKGIFPEKGIEYSGSLELYKKVLMEFTDTGLSRADVIEGYFEQEDIKNYTIQVHALKSAARIIGATPLSQLAMALEEAGNAGDMVKIQNATGELLRLYREIVEKLDPLLNSGEDKLPIDEDSLKDALTSLREVVEAFDFDSVDSIMEELNKYKMPDHFKEKYTKLKTLVAEVARDDILLLLEGI